jgi:Cyclin, N-terminal domain/Cyclin, C-terminal domain
MEQQPTIS